jgi:hypothetical protein
MGMVFVRKIRIPENPEVISNPVSEPIPIPNRSRSFDQIPIPIPTEFKMSIPLGSARYYIHVL